MKGATTRERTHATTFRATLHLIRSPGGTASEDPAVAAPVGFESTPAPEKPAPLHSSR